MKQGWEIKKLGEVCQVSAGQGAPQGEDKYGTIGKPFIKAGNLEGLLSGVDESEIQHVNEDVAKQHRLKLYPRGSVLFAKSGMSCMKGHVYALKTDCYVVSHLALLTPTGISTQFLTYLLNYYRPNTLVKDSAYPSISLEDIKVFKVPVPPISEQEKIVAELDCLSGIIEKKKQQLRELDNLAQSIFYEMFGDPNTNDKNWELIKVSEICENLDYRRKPITAKDRISGKIPYYGASGIVDYVEGYIFDGRYLLVSEDGANLLMRNTPIAFTILGKTWVNNHAHVLYFEDPTTHLFVEHYLNLLDLSDVVRGCAQPKLTQASLNDLSIFKVDFPLQQDFASKIEAIEKQKELIAQSIKETETLFNSRMDYYFN